MMKKRMGLYTIRFNERESPPIRILDYCLRVLLNIITAPDATTNAITASPPGREAFVLLVIGVCWLEPVVIA